jgi:hypothetical protein
MILPRLIVGALLLSGTASATAAVIVVRASGPSATQYPVGKSLPDSASVRLQGGDTLVLLDGKGTRTLRGPGSFPAAARGSAASSTSFSALLASANTRRGRVGAVRPPPQPRQTWQVSADAAETFCFVAPGMGLRVRREDLTEPRTLVIRDPATGKSAEVKFDAGQQLADWPASLPITEGRYRIGPVETTMKPISAGASFADLGSAFIQNGCTAQLDALSNSTAYAAAE